MAPLCTDARRLHELGRDLFERTRQTRSRSVLYVPVRDYGRFGSEDMVFYSTIQAALQQCNLSWLGDLEPIPDPPPEEPRPATFIGVFGTHDGSIVVDMELAKPAQLSRLLSLASRAVPFPSRCMSATTVLAPEFVLSTDNTMSSRFHRSLPFGRSVGLPSSVTPADLLSRHRAELEWSTKSQPTLSIRPILTVDDYAQAARRFRDQEREYFARTGYLGDEEALWWLKLYYIEPNAQKAILAGVAEARAEAQKAPPLRQ